MSPPPSIAAPSIPAASLAAGGPLRVAVLCGGDSPEREISLESGRCVLEALSEAGHRPQMVDPARLSLASLDPLAFDVCYVALHGGDGENGVVQRALELRGLPYTGSGPLASQLAMSKSAAKSRFRIHDVPTLPWTVCDWQGDRPAEMAFLAGLQLPIAVKPDGQGSSLGVSRVDHLADLPAALERAASFDRHVLIEPWIEGREFTVALIDREPLPLLEIVTPRAFLDFEAKYRQVATVHRFDHGLPEGTSQRIIAAAVAAAGCLETRGLSRVDLRLDATGQPWVLEVNASPGMTRQSMAPAAARQAGCSMSKLCDRLVRMALRTGAGAHELDSLPELAR